MPRDLADVLHYFVPEAGEAESPAARPSTPRPSEPRPKLHPAALPMLAVPIGDRDVVRAAFAWNLAFEVSRLGGQSALVAPDRDLGAALWPECEADALGADVLVAPAADIGELYRAALDIAVSRAAASEEGGLILVQVPPPWLARPGASAKLLRWALLFSSSEPRELMETYGIAKLLVAAHPSARLGVTIHGARRVAEAESAFSRLSRTAHRHLGRSFTSYGMLVNDLDVYRAIVAQRPIGLTHPQSPAARALRDVARLLLEDARTSLA